MLRGDLQSKVGDSLLSFPFETKLTARHLFLNILNRVLNPVEQALRTFLLLLSCVALELVLESSEASKFRLVSIHSWLEEIVDVASQVKALGVHAVFDAVEELVRECLDHLALGELAITTACLLKVLQAHLIGLFKDQHEALSLGL